MKQTMVMRTKEHRKMKRERTGFLFVLPSLLGVSIFLFLPWLDVIRRSFTGNLSGDFVGIRNYITIFTNKAFLLAAKSTGKFILVCIPLLLSLSLGIAVFLQSKTQIGNYIKSGFLIPMAIPVVSVVLLWRLLFDKGGMLNGFLHMLGFAGQDWMNTKSAFYVLVFSYIWKNLGYDIVLWMAGLSSISPEIYEAAKVDGAGSWARFRYITVPNLKNTLFIIVVLSIINSFKVFREAYLIAGDYPHKSIYLLQHTFNNWFRDLSLDKISAGAVTLSLTLCVLIGLLGKLWGKEN